MENCDCLRSASISAKCSDCFCSSEGVREYDGYVPTSPIGSGDYIEFTFCLDCGKIQGKFPVADGVIAPQGEVDD